MRVRPSPDISYFYPDVLVVCGEPRFEDNTFDILINPIVLIEVLSPSTETFDRGEKFKHYQQLTSLREYMLVSQDEVRVELHRLQETAWKLTESDPLKMSCRSPQLTVNVTLTDIYNRVEFRENQV